MAPLEFVQETVIVTFLALIVDYFYSKPVEPARDEATFFLRLFAKWNRFDAEPNAFYEDCKEDCRGWVRVNCLRSNPEWDAGIKPRVSPRTRGVM